jgi:nickel superoxide dismutase
MTLHFLTVLIAITFSSFNGNLNAHCQMPCGIYNDQMIYDQVDQYFETMAKAVHYLKNHNSNNLQDKNQFVRWILTKEKESDEVARTLTTFFLQQKVSPSDEPETTALVKSLHKLLFLLVQIKQTIDLEIVHEFGKEWDHFKQLFHPEMECHHVVPKEVLKKSESGEQAEKGHYHDGHYHTHEDDHEHIHHHGHHGDHHDHEHSHDEKDTY